MFLRASFGYIVDYEDSQKLTFVKKWLFWRKSELYIIDL